MMSVLAYPLGLIKKCLAYFDLVQTHTETILSRSENPTKQQLQKRIAALDQANKALQAEIAEQTRVERHLRTLLQEKEVLLKETHHRAKNSLQSVSYLLDLQASYSNEPKVTQMLHEAQDRIRAMALIYEKLYQSQDLIRINMAEYAQTLATQLLQAYAVNPDRITLYIKADEVFLNTKTATPCALILTELITNVLKHAFPASRQGEIRIELWQNPDNLLTLVVADNGIGFPVGLDYQATTSLGLKLVYSLVNQLDGAIAISHQNGTEFRINFTAPPHEG
jgi:two-component sensor histidine kinase